MVWRLTGLGLGLLGRHKKFASIFYRYKLSLHQQEIKLDSELAKFLLNIAF